jgi:DNA-binding CsgD family transcriptional regulator
VDVSRRAGRDRPQAARPATHPRPATEVARAWQKALRHARHAPTEPAPDPREPGVFDPGSLGLSPRESEVVGLLTVGETVKTTAARLGISPNTVKSHLKRVHRKLGVSNRAELCVRLFARPDPPNG